MGTMLIRWGMMSPSQSDREDEERNIDRPHFPRLFFFNRVFR